MANNSPSDSDFDLYSLESDIDDFDPLADVGLEDDDVEDVDPEDQVGDGFDYDVPVSMATDALEEEGTGEGAGEGEAAPKKKVDTRTPKERIDDLFDSMKDRRKELLGILDFCREPQSVDDVNDRVEELKKNSFSVYSGAHFCTLLENAGAIERRTAEGELAKDIQTEPEVVVEDGVEYLEAGTPEQSFWVTTADGIAALEADKPYERMEALLETDARYKPIYKRILTLCTEKNGTPIATINGAVNDDPLVKHPHLYAAHFVDKLEQCDALEYRDGWFTTEVGQKALELLADVLDEPAQDEDEEAKDEEAAQA